ncbi:phage tail tape measure protein [Fictibacillus sp. JL2B1089]|uniref:phage tail tape measure protein n=1 Tax=Fictibacillus sp. JL2B1089 TaxID=3399565 RepID=UPI003A836CFF
MPDETIGTIKGDVKLDQSDFRQGVASINRELRVVKSEFEASSAKVKAFGRSQDEAKNQAVNLGRQIDLQRRKVELLQNAHDKYSKEIGANAKQTQNLAVELNKARAVLTNFEGSLNRANRQMDTQAQSVERLGTRLDRLRGFADESAIALGVMSGALTVALGSAVNKAMDFEAQLSSVSAVSGATAEEMRKLKDQALEVGAATKYSALEAAQGQEELIKAGLTLDQVINGGLEGALSLAAAGELELADAAEIASTALNAFKDDNLEVADAADILAGAANASATSVGEMRYGLSMVSAVASGVGLSFEDTSTALALFAQNGLKGSDAGTSLKTMLMNLSPATKDANEAMFDLGIAAEDGSNAFFDAQGNIKSMAEIAGVLHEALKDLNPQQRGDELRRMFGSDAIRAGTILFKEGAKGIEDMAEAMNKVTAADVAAERMDNLKGTVEELKGAFETVQIEMGTALIPMLKDLAEGTSDVVDWFTNLSPSTKDMIVNFTALSAGALGVGAAVAGILAIANPITGVIIGGGIAVSGLISIINKFSDDSKKAQSDARNFGEGVSEGTKKAADGYVKMRDRALGALNDLAFSTGAEAKKAVDNAQAEFAKLADKAMQALEKDKARFNEFMAKFFGDASNEGVQRVEQDLKKDAEEYYKTKEKAIRDAESTMNELTSKYGNNIFDMSAKDFQRYQGAWEKFDSTTGTAVAKSITELKAVNKAFDQIDKGVSLKQAQKEIEKLNTTSNKALQEIGKARDKDLDKAKKYSEQMGYNHQQEAALIDQISYQYSLQESAIYSNQLTKTKQVEEALGKKSEELDLEKGLTKAQKDRMTSYLDSGDRVLAKQDDINANNDRHTQKLRDNYQDSTLAAKEHYEAVVKFGKSLPSATEGLFKGLQQDKKVAKAAGEAISVSLMDGTKAVDLGSAGVVKVDEFVSGVKSGQYTIRDVAIASINSMKAQLGQGSLTDEGLKDISSYHKGLQQLKVEEIAQKLQLNLKKNMDVDLGPYGKTSVKSFVEGLKSGTFDIDALYFLYQSRLESATTFDLTKTGQQNINTLLQGMNLGFFSVEDAARQLGLDIQSNVKVDLGKAGQQNVQSLLVGLQSKKIDIDTFVKGVQLLMEEGAKIDLSAEGRSTTLTLSQGINNGRPEVEKSASSTKAGIQNILGSTSDGGGGKKSTSDMERGISGNQNRVLTAAGFIKSGTAAVLGLTSDNGGGRKATSDFTKGITSGERGAGTAASKVAGAARNNLKVSDASTLGANVAAGFASGIFGGELGVIRAATSIARSAWQAIKTETKQKSPSKKTEELGMFTAMGYEVGMKGRLSQVERLGLQLAHASMPILNRSGFSLGSKLPELINEKLNAHLNVSTPGTNSTQNGAPQPIIIQSVLNGRIIAEELIDDVSAIQKRKQTESSRARGEY